MKIINFAVFWSVRGVFWKQQSKNWFSTSSWVPTHPLIRFLKRSVLVTHTRIPLSLCMQWRLWLLDYNVSDGNSGKNNTLYRLYKFCQKDPFTFAKMKRSSLAFVIKKVSFHGRSVDLRGIYHPLGQFCAFASYRFLNNCRSHVFDLLTQVMEGKIRFWKLQKCS